LLKDASLFHRSRCTQLFANIALQPILVNLEMITVYVTTSVINCFAVDAMFT